MNNCPFCYQDVDTEISKYFWRMLPSLQGGSYFDFICPYCEHTIEIEVIANPDFNDGCCRV
jgi:hypothetical protein